MKLEPVAWMTHESSMRLKDGGNCKGAVPVHQQRSHASSIPLYAIPEGYVVVPVEQAKNAELLTWLIEKHGEQIRQIMWSYKQCCGDEINALGVKALITAAKEQS